MKQGRHVTVVVREGRGNKKGETVGHLRFGRLLAVVALATSGVLGTVVVAAGPATATTLKIVCTGLTISGSTATVTGCSGNTGGSGTVPTSSLAPPGGSGTVSWINGKSTSVTVSTCAGEGCNPKADKTGDSGGSCATGSTEFETVGKVTADTTGSATVGGTTKAEACVDSAGNVTLEPGTKIKI